MDVWLRGWLDKKKQIIRETKLITALISTDSNTEIDKEGQRKEARRWIRKVL